MDRTPPPFPSVLELERQFDIPPDTYCGLTPEHMSRAIVAYHGGPRRPGEPVGSMPVGSEAHRLDWLRQEFGDDADVERIRVLVQFFGGRVSRAMKLDWKDANNNAEVRHAHSYGCSLSPKQVTAGCQKQLGWDIQATPCPD
ncbi:MAG: hypothetical protein ACKO35_13325, partial [Planctomycetaceae bacterium]